MANIFRVPVRVEIIPPYRVQDYTQANLLLGTLSLDANPFTQRDWPNPVLRTRTVSTFSWRPSNIAAPNTKPNHQDHWPLPLRIQQPNEHLTWISESLELLTSSSVAPFTSVNLPNPLVTPRFTMPVSHRYAGGPVTITVVTDPFIAKDFPNPLIRQPFSYPQVSRVLESLTETNPSLLGLEFPNPIRRMPPPMVYDPQQPIFTTLPLSNPVPFTQGEWPNPVLRPRSINQLSGWADELRFTLALSNPYPFSQTEFPNPLPIQYPQQRDFDLNGIFTIEPPPPIRLVMRKTLAAMGTRIMSRQKHLAGG